MLNDVRQTLLSDPEKGVLLLCRQAAGVTLRLEIQSQPEPLAEVVRILSQGGQKPLSHSRRAQALNQKAELIGCLPQSSSGLLGDLGGSLAVLCDEVLDQLDLRCSRDKLRLNAVVHFQSEPAPVGRNLSSSTVFGGSPREKREE